MENKESIKIMIEHLKQNGAPRWLIAPLPYRLLWKIGITANPPLFSSFLVRVLIFSSFFMPLYGLGVICIELLFDTINPIKIIFSVLGSGLFFGLAMAFIYHVYAKRLDLPSNIRIDE